MEVYDHKRIEPKWQKRWLDEGLFRVQEDVPKGKMYVLDMFPYPSGDGLHVGHVKIYTASDVVARYLRMKGFKVLHPTGWDAFGLPTENSAIKFGVHPMKLTRKNVDRFREQMQMMGFSYDWGREINTTDPQYYKWTQWIFLQLYKMGLAYQDAMPINWCKSCKTGLANEEVEEGRCERCGSTVEQKPLKQWMLRITKYADRLLHGLDGLEWPDFIIESQRNWIGRSEGVEMDFRVDGSDKVVRVFTTRPDTIFGATYVVLSSEHPLIGDICSAEQKNEVEEYCRAAAQKPEAERLNLDRKREGVFSGAYVINPVNGERLPVWVADYVLMSYGTGAIMAVPAHDARDFSFAGNYNLPVVQVIQPVIAEESSQLPFTGDGVLINSGDYSGIEAVKAKGMITESLQLKGVARKRVNYKLRDWVFSRQHYWGEPIPIIHCESCGAVPVPEDDLPVELPPVENYEPTGGPESPLAAIADWVNVKCPACPRMAKRETDTMPNWAGSSWYWLRYLDAGNNKKIAAEERLNEWLPVDIYVGGAEHAVLHLLYARFWNSALFDMGIVPQEEPFKRFRSVGLLLGGDGQKMSKSRGNVVNPDEVVERLGADALRVYVMFMGPFSSAMPWSEAGLNGSSRFLQRVWKVANKLLGDAAFSDKSSVVEETPELNLQVQQTIRRVSEGTEQFRFNTAIAALMELLNELEGQGTVTRATLETFVLLLAPYAPHMAEELWSKLGHTESIVYKAWPEIDGRVLSQAAVTIPVQVNGKVRGKLVVQPDVPREQIEVAARHISNVARYLALGQVKDVVYVPNRMINFVVK